jgi:hypothetical protein
LLSFAACDVAIARGRQLEFAQILACRSAVNHRLTTAEQIGSRVEESLVNNAA